MHASSDAIALLALLAVLGCGPAPPDTGYHEVDCLTLAGGFEGADLEEVEADCRERGDTACSSEAWIQADAARCVAWGGWWSVELREGLSAWLGVRLLGRPHTTWGVREYDDPDRCASYVAAATGESITIICPD